MSTSSDAPELKDAIEELLVDEGVNVSMSCEAEGSPLFFNWTCDGQNMNVSMSVLNITQVTTTRSCMCVVYNYLGAASKIIRLGVTRPLRLPMPLDMTTLEPVVDTGTAKSSFLVGLNLTSASDLNQLWVFLLAIDRLPPYAHAS